MKNRKIITIIVMILVLLSIPNFICDGEDETLTEWEEIKTLGSLSWENDDPNILYKKFMNNEISCIKYDFNDTSQKMNWFIEYKNIESEYPKELHKQSIYETYSKEELDLLFRIVQCETGSEYSFIEKANVVSVIFNRCKKQNKTITEVLTKKNAFTPYETGVYKKAVVDEKTILACEYVFMFGDTTNGCVAFRSHKECPIKWYSWTRQFRDDAHCFYK